MRRAVAPLSRAVTASTVTPHRSSTATTASATAIRTATAAAFSTTAPLWLPAASVASGLTGNKKRTAPDVFLRDGTATSRFFKKYRTSLPFPLRMLGIFFLGFSLGLVIEVFACKTHLYESVMMKKDARRHDFDEFVVDFRQNVERWQREDMASSSSSSSSTAGKV